MKEISVKTHLIVTDMHDEYNINWCGKIKDTKPKFKNNRPIFVVVSSGGRIELNTTDMKMIENCAKSLTRPKGRSSVTTDTARIFIKEENDNEVLVGVLTHNHIKSFAPVHDKVYWK